MQIGTRGVEKVWNGEAVSIRLEGLRERRPPAGYGAEPRLKLNFIKSRPKCQRSHLVASTCISLIFRKDVARILSRDEKKAMLYAVQHTWTP